MTNELVRPTIPIAYLVEMTARGRASARAVARALAAASLPARALSAPRLRVSIAQLERYDADGAICATRMWLPKGSRRPKSMP